MRYLVALLLGLAVGVAAFLALLYFNPMTTRNHLSPLSVSDNQVITFNYSAVATDAIVYTNDGESQVIPHPAKVLQLWEPTVRRSDALATVLRDGRNAPAAIGIKFSSDSERTNVLNGEAIVDSVWHVYAPGQGTLFVEQRENYWDFLRDIMIPARWSSGDNWRGNWNGSITSGPGALGTSRVFGGSGIFAGIETDAVESLSAKAYSVEFGPVAMDAELAIEIPRRDASLSQDP
ncbi:MAG: hypothetical protein QNJ23_02995 [Woeseiaceae bacterium]|nr:hypothetical protein [Woeseiaceae bacterium]